MAVRLRDAGMPDEDVRVIGPLPHKGNLVARLRGSGARPPLLLAHLDVVDARREDWTVDPFTFLERDGWFYGRGTTDDKAMAAIWMANLLRFAREGWVPNRDIVLALTADEEGGTHNGAAWLLHHRRNLVEAAYGLNEGGYGRLQAGHRIANQVQASEKVYLDFQLEATGHGGHSSLPSASPDDGAIHRLSRALVRLAAFRFPVTLGEVTHAFFARMAERQQGALADDMRAVACTPPDDAARRGALLQRPDAHDVRAHQARGSRGRQHDPTPRPRGGELPPAAYADVSGHSCRASEISSPAWSRRVEWTVYSSSQAFATSSRAPFPHRLIPVAASTISTMNAPPTRAAVSRK